MNPTTPAPANAIDTLRSDVVLVGSGIMSATLGVLLKCLDPGLSIEVFESHSELAQESSHGWNNAGTGHAGLCELSYTPHRGPDGEVDVSKALEIFEQFECSRQFWAYAVRAGILHDPHEFIRPLPHMSFVSGRDSVNFLASRFRGMSAHPFFAGMQYTSDPEQIRRWAPLLMESRGSEPVAATRVEAGTDVNFGVLSRQLLAWLGAQPGCAVHTSHRVTGLRRQAGRWNVHIASSAPRRNLTVGTPFVFVGAGGGSLPLLQGSGIPESRGIGGFPIGGQWLVCDNPEIVEKHIAKVYGQALGAAPTMAVPHLDTRVLDGKHVLLFGPFAAWTTRFLHRQGSHLDLPLSVRHHNLRTLLQIAAKNLELIRYLRQQGMQSKEDRLRSLRDFYPAARAEDWRLVDAGIRVQAIKRTDGQAGIVHYGTEIIADEDKSIAALLGASPGASVSGSIALDVIAACLPHLLQSNTGRERIHTIVPTWGIDIKVPANAEFYREASAEASQTLQLG